MQKKRLKWCDPEITEFMMDTGTGNCHDGSVAGRGAVPAVSNCSTGPSASACHLGQRASSKARCDSGGIPVDQV